MSMLPDLLDREFTTRLVTVLAHSLWQAPLLAMLAWGFMRSIPARRANLRYVLLLIALGSVMVATAATWTLLGPREEMATTTQVSVPPDTGSVEQRSGHQPPPSEAIHPSTATEMAGVSEPVPASGESTAAAQQASQWPTAIAATWLVGVCLMLVRIGRAMHQSIALAAESMPVPADIIDRVREQCRRLRIAREPAVILSERISVPGIIGVVWPTLVLPVSLVTGVSPREMEAVIVHELLHICRHDFTVNLVQMLVEAFYFFNPAVWWISRRIRIEREACVDARVVTVTGQSLEYATLLAKVAERLTVGGPAPALVAFSGKSQDGTLLERVKRVIEPGIAPRVRLPWATLLVLLALSAVGMAALWQGTSAVVAMAQELMSDAERVEALEVAQEEFAPAVEIVEAGQGKIGGTVRTEDGQPLPEGGWLYYQSRRSNTTTLGTAGKMAEEFLISVEAGNVWLLADVKDYAPVWTGPFVVRPDEVVDGAVIVLPLGFAASVRISDALGRPIEGATLSGGLLKQGGSAGRPDRGWVSDADGIIAIPHAADGVYRLTAKRSGFQPLQTKVSFSPGKPVELQLDAAKPFKGQVVSVEGQPVPGAKVRAFYELDPSGTGREHGSWGPTWAETDERGRFQLTELKDRFRYALLIESDRWGAAVMTGVVPGGSQVVTIGPLLTLRGEITGPLEKLSPNRSRPSVLVAQAVQVSDTPHRECEIRRRATVEEQDGVGTFELPGLLPGEAVVSAGRHRAEASLSAEEPITSVQIDLAEPIPTEEVSHREVIFRFVQDSRPVALDGTVGILGYATEGPRDTVHRNVTVSEGTAAIEVPVPGRVQCDPENIVGWYFEDVSEAVEQGEGPLTIDVPVVPGGAVKGHVTYPPGYQPEQTPQVSVHAKWQEGQTPRQETIYTEVGEDGRYFATPIRLGTTCTVKLAVGHNIQVSEPFTLAAAEPLREVDLRLPEPASAVVEVVDPEGRPAKDLRVDLHWERSGASGHNWQSDRLTDRNGRIEFTGLNAEVPQYSVSFDSRQTWQPVRARLSMDGRVTRLQLERGNELAVTVLDAASGYPVPGVQVYAIRQPVSREFNAPNIFEAEARTDEDGKARFSNLPDSRVELGLRGMKDTQTLVDPRRTDHVELRGEIPEWSELRPRPPK